MMSKSLHLSCIWIRSKSELASKIFNTSFHVQSIRIEHKIKPVKIHLLFNKLSLHHAPEVIFGQCFAFRIWTYNVQKFKLFLIQLQWTDMQYYFAQFHSVYIFYRIELETFKFFYRKRCACRRGHIIHILLDVLALLASLLYVLCVMLINWIAHCALLYWVCSVHWDGI